VPFVKKRNGKERKGEERRRKKNILRVKFLFLIL